MNSFEIYQLYLAIKLHFTSDKYDCFKYNFKVKADTTSFDHRRDRFFFEKLAKHPDPRGFILANILANRRGSVRDLAYGEQSKKIYTEWLKTKESLTYFFTSDLEKLLPDFNENFRFEVGSHPHVLKLYLGHKITLETLCILCDLTGCLKYWDKVLKDDVIYQDLGLLIHKYMPFIQCDKDEMKRRMRDKFSI